MNWSQPKVYAVKHNDRRVVAASRSGGIFTALSDLILEKDGIVYGCILNEKLEAVHVWAEDKDGRDAMRGSKYTQSRLGDVFKKVRIDLDSGKDVLFSGTSCQVKGLKKFLGKEYTNLYCVDIVCHGVPSPTLWRSYLIWQENKNKSKIVSANFRNKEKYGWRDHVETLHTENGNRINSKVYTQLFYSHNALRPSCYKCPFKSVMHPGDITIADYWGIERAAPEFDDNKGVSLVLINNQVGMDIFESIRANIIWKETCIEDSMQGPLKDPCKVPKERNAFWKDYQSKGFDYVARKYGGYGLVSKIKRKLRAFIGDR